MKIFLQGILRSEIFPYKKFVCFFPVIVKVLHILTALWIVDKLLYVLITYGISVISKWSPNFSCTLSREASTIVWWAFLPLDHFLIKQNLIHQNTALNILLPVNALVSKYAHCVASRALHFSFLVPLQVYS